MLRKALLLVFLSSCNINPLICISSPFIKEVPSSPALNLTLGAVTGAVALWLISETLRDCGHRYLPCKNEKLIYRKKLEQHAQGMLTEKELDFWSTVQGISTVPKNYWREISASAISIALLYLSTRSLTRGVSAIYKNLYY